MSDTIDRFSNRVENYVKYRPDYPREVLRLFETEMNLQKTSALADIGSGTGISAHLFLKNGCSVFGVEPNAAMRAAAENFLREFSNFKSVDGTSDATTLENESVDFVVAAQAFHWFDKTKARAEFKRILKQNGFVALMWNERQLDANEFLRAYEKFLIRFGNDYEQTRHDNIDERALKDFFQADFRRATFQNVQTLNLAGLKGRLLSSSYMPTEENPAYQMMIKELKGLFAEYAKNDRINILYDTNVFYARI
ncbi:MAG: class I SAM-dependent methyltransferase [Acidobacteria bacterium]|jgi:SAM-dependent methyltransferase|nr:class I SAM-dependent methyltransferase [Acidobacteriota bacterium]